MIAEDPSIQATVCSLSDEILVLSNSVCLLSHGCIRWSTKVLGVREGDPGSSYISTFSPTDGDWPKVWTANTIHCSNHTFKMMRVHPVLAWQYSDVWTFLRGLSIPYPVLYDQVLFIALSTESLPPVIWLHIFAQGYTSLGNPENTIRNPALAYTDPLGETRWVLVDQEKIFTFWIKSSYPGSTQPTCWRTLLWKGKAGSETWTKSSEMFDNIPTNSLPPSLVLAKAL